MSTLPESDLICVVGGPSPQHQEHQQKLHQAHAALQAALIATTDQQQQREEQEAALLQEQQQQQRQEVQTSASADAFDNLASGTPFLSPPQAELALPQHDSAQANTNQPPQHELSITQNVSLVPQARSAELWSQSILPPMTPPALSASTGLKPKKTKDSASVQDCFIPPPELGPAPAASFTALSPSTLPPLLRQLLLGNKKCSCSNGSHTANCNCSSSKPSCSNISSSRGDCWTNSGGGKCSSFLANSMDDGTNEQVVAGMLLLPVYSALRGAFPLLGTYFQVNVPHKIIDVLGPSKPHEDSAATQERAVVA